MEFNSPPQAQGRPWDFVAGMDASNDQLQLREQQRYALEQMVLDNRNKQLTNSRYEQETPLHLQGRQATNRLTDAQAGETNQRGRLTGHQADLMGATWRDQAGATNAQSKLSRFENSAQLIEHQAAVNPMLGAAAYREQYLSWPAELQQVMPSAYTPEVPQMLRAIGKSVQNNFSQQRLMDRDRQAQSSAQTISGGNNDATVEAARIGAESRETVARMRAAAMDPSNKRNFQQFLTNFATKKAAGQTTPLDEEMAQMVEKMMYNQASMAQIDPVMYKMWVLQGMQPGAAPVPGPKPTPPTAIPGAQPKPGSRENPIKLK